MLLPDLPMKTSKHIVENPLYQWELKHGDTWIAIYLICASLAVTSFVVCLVWKIRTSGHSNREADFEDNLGLVVKRDERRRKRKKFCHDFLAKESQEHEAETRPLLLVTTTEDETSRVSSSKGREIFL